MDAPTLQPDLERLLELHQALFAAIADVDVAAVGELIARRGALLDHLAVAFAAAPDAERAACQPRLRDLAREDRELTARITAARDALEAELARTRRLPPAPAAPRGPGGLDRRA